MQELASPDRRFATIALLAGARAAFLCWNAAFAEPSQPARPLLPLAVAAPLLLDPLRTPSRDHTVRHVMVPMTDGFQRNTRVSTPAAGSGSWPVMLHLPPDNIEETDIDGVADPLRLPKHPDGEDQVGVMEVVEKRVTAAPWASWPRRCSVSPDPVARLIELGRSATVVVRVCDPIEMREGGEDGTDALRARGGVVI